jgi:hypothetical protein
MAKKSILDPEFGILETEKGESVAYHARKGTMTFKPSLVSKAARYAGGGGGGNVKHKGEIVVTNQAIWCGKVMGLFKKRAHIYLVAVHDSAYAEEWVQNAVAQIHAATGGSKWAARVSRAQRIYFITQVLTGKGLISKGFDLKLVRFNPKGQRTGIGRAFRGMQQALDSSFAGETWAFRIKKPAPGYEMAMGALDGILASAQAGGQQMAMNLQRYNQMADSAAMART